MSMVKIVDNIELMEWICLLLSAGLDKNRLRPVDELLSINRLIYHTSMSLFWFR